jgi:hypothetical protein
VLVVVAEPVSPAVRRAPGTCLLALSQCGEPLWVPVGDTGSSPPVPRRADLTAAADCFGRRLLHSLADRVDVHPGEVSRTASPPDSPRLRREEALLGERPAGLESSRNGPRFPGRKASVLTFGARPAAGGRLAISLAPRDGCLLGQHLLSAVETEKRVGPAPLMAGPRGPL